MPSQPGNGGQGGPWGSGGTPLDLEVLVRQGRDRLGQMLPSGSPRGLIALVLLALAGLDGGGGDEGDAGVVVDHLGIDVPVAPVNGEAGTRRSPARSSVGM